MRGRSRHAGCDVFVAEAVAENVTQNSHDKHVEASRRRLSFTCKSQHCPLSCLTACGVNRGWS